MKKISLSFLLLTSTFLTHAISAKPIEAEVKITELKNTKLTSYFLDQVYFHILEIDNQGKTTASRIPKFPLVSPVKKNTKLTNISLWKKVLNDGDSYQVIITVAEQDISKFSTDDLIGQAAVTFSNDGKKLITHWSVPQSDRKQTTKLLNEKDIILYEMKGDKGNYQVSFQR